MTAWMRCGCGWQGRRDYNLHLPCPTCGGPVEFSPVQGALLAVVLRERFGEEAAPPAAKLEIPRAKGQTLEELLGEW